MIEVFKSLTSIGPETAWRMPFAVLSGLATVALAPLFVVSNRVLMEPSRHNVLTLSRIKPTAATPSRHAPSARPAPAGAHWQQIARGLEDRIQSVRKTVALQSAALVQVDAVDFSLAKIVEDLVTIMPSASDLRTRAPRPQPVPLRALAA